MKVFISTVILLCALGLAYGLYANKPVTRKKKPKIAVPVVETMTLKKSSENIHLQAYGSVIPARTLELRTEVDGRVVRLNKEIVPGGIVEKGEFLLEVDAVNYELLVVELQAEVARAEYELELEKGQQVIARQEWQLLESEIESTEASRALALREPHLKQAKIKLKAAKSKLEAAQLEVRRTKLHSPFHGLVLEESIEVGQLLNRQTPIVTLVDIDTFWVQVSLPFSQLNRIRFPSGDRSEGSGVKVIWEQDDGPSIIRPGKLFKLLGDLEPKGRMAQLLVSLDDPFNLTDNHTGKILLGSFVKVEIGAGVLEDIYVVPRVAIRDDRIWLVDGENRLKEVKVEILWRRVDDLLISAELEPGAQLVTSRLLSPLPGTRVMTEPKDSKKTNIVRQ